MIEDAFGNIWQDVSTPTDKDWPHRKYIKTQTMKSPFHPDYKHTGNEQLQPARSYIKDNIEAKYAKKLLKGVETYIKYIAKVNYNEFKVTDLVSNLNEIAKQRGVGTLSINALEQQLKQDGWL